ncbi:helix-turn-helix domain-containing protein [Cellulomonas sp. S1-8]|uniref:helix-turn-helix domain-containing protein n=1 Tax=Cellulomonas sp. S1-8 TaxID=2904790 RepID=UPI002243DD23|nr:helix-turn-helix domain-containing protein [Cellulomonas sp. S1-8]UZN05050.1 helix-turn-helix transcriptional regulator [Cellulomonas sp. S1-8]
MTFGTTLRAWRTRRALSQERLAAAAGTVARHVSRLETGRAHPSAAMVRALAGALDVPPGGVEDLLAAAGHAPRPAATPPSPGPALLAAVGRVLDAHEPYPAFALDPGWHVVAHNAAAGRLLACLDPDALVGRHALRMALHPGGLVGLASDDAPWRAALLARAADQAAAVASDRLARELAAWGGPTHARADVAVPVRLRLPSGDVTLLAMSTRLAVPDEPAAAGLTIDTFLPADAASKRLLESAAPDPGRA